MINQQSAAIRSTSSMKQHNLICQLRTNTRPLALDRQTITATESGTTATTKHSILLSTYHHLIMAQLNNRKRNLYIIQPSRPRGRSHLQCCCVAFPGAVIAITTTSSSFSHACASHVYIHVCTCASRDSINKCTTMIPTAVPWGFLYSNFIVWFDTKYDANLEVMFCQVILSTSPYIKIRRITGECRSKYKILRAFRLDGGLQTK